MIERIGPLFFSILVSVFFYILKLNFSNFVDYKFVYSNTISFSSIIIGFLITMVSILLTLTNRKIMKTIRDYKADNLLKSYFAFPVASGLIIIIYSVILAVIFDWKILKEYYVLFSSIWMFLFCYLILTTIRIIYIMLKLLNRVFQEDTAIKSKRVEPKIDKLYFDKGK